MGGMIAQSLAAHWPNRMATLTSIFSTTGAPQVGQPALSTRLRMALPPARTRSQAVNRRLTMMRHNAGTSMPLDEAAAATYAATAWDRPGRRCESPPLHW